MTQDHSAPTLSLAEVTDPVRRLLASKAAQVVVFFLERLGGGYGNPVSLGLYRVTGAAREGDITVPFSLVLKLAQSPANVGEAGLGEGPDPSHWNYWQREYHVYRSGLFDELPPGLAAPRCYGAELMPGDVYRLWLEEIEGRPGQTWPLERYGLAARHLGRFNGRLVLDAGDRPALPGQPWLSRSLLRQWCDNLADWVPHLVDPDPPPGWWAHPLVLRVFPPPEENPFKRLLEARQQVVAALDTLPQTLCHLDAYPTNLIARQGPGGEDETVALDWALAGFGTLGEDLAQLLFGALNEVPGVDPARAEALVFGRYLEGLADAGWRGDERPVRQGFAACAALRIGMVAAWTLAGALEGEGGVRLEDASPEAIEAAVESGARTAAAVLALSEETLGWLAGR